METLDIGKRLKDPRRGKRGAAIVAFIVAKGRVVMQKSDQWKEQMSFYRFFNNEGVSEQDLAGCLRDHCLKQSEGLKEVLLLQDTTEIDVERHRKRITDQHGLGEIANQYQRLGFYCHATVAVNPEDQGLLGIVDAHLYHRERAEGEASRSARKAWRHEGIEEKESWRWPSRAIAARKLYGAEQTVTAIQDREGDIYESFCLLAEGDVEYVIRSRGDRNIVAEGGGKERLEAYLERQPGKHEFRMAINGENKQRKQREALLELNYGRVTLQKTGIPGRTGKKYPRHLEVSVVRVKEQAETVPPGEQAIAWTLLSSHPVETVAEALKLVGYYKTRWVIEELFRAVKSEGVNYEETELERGPALRKLFILALYGAMILVQMRQARGGTTNQKPSLLFSEEQQACLKDIGGRFEGKTERLKNPYAPATLAHSVWIIARLGGWKGYASQRPPGVVTLYEGWTRFQNIYEGWAIAKDVYKR